MQIDPSKLVEARLARSMSQEEAAIASDLSARTIQRIEAGHAASLESTKALLTIFGANIIHDPTVATPEALNSPWQSLASQIRRTSRLSASLGFDSLRILFAVTFIVIAVAKPLVPRQTGLFVRGEFYDLGLLKHPPAGSHEVLGYWIMPLMVVAAAAILVSIGRLRELVENQYAKGF
ncbi:helix-turn-helix transcriptional regulator [Novosphingobium sp.]|uniref:helix-turn-helix transcriptional regulator n=1 Tax=Novosphingobium sp. TaxID=1874826 RepID=UPI0025E0D377|nr:helix-turn-helix transcriptional regulator [Novosphingobium sp.]